MSGIVKTRVGDLKPGEGWAEKTQAPQVEQKTIQTVTFSTGSFNDEDRTFIAIASTPVVDRMGDTIAQEGWQLDNFLKNPVIPWAHDYWQPPIARAVEIGVNAQGYLQFKYQAPQEGMYPFADIIWNLYRNQYLFAFSVGFKSIEREGDWDTGYNFRKAELLEISAVVVPANPQAVALAYDAGVLDLGQLKTLHERMAGSFKAVEDRITQASKDNDEENKSTGADKKNNDDDAQDRLEIKGAIKSNLPTNTDKEATWDATAAKKRIKDWATNGDGELDYKKYAKAFFYVVDGEEDKRSGYKLPFADIVDGGAKAIWRGVSAAMAALNGARGGVDMSDADKQAVYNQIKKYYAKFDEEAPDLKGLTISDNVDDNSDMSTKAGAKLSKATKAKLQAVYDGLEDVRAKCESYQKEIGDMLSGEATDDDKADAADATKDQDAQDQGEMNGADNGEQQAGDDDAKGNANSDGAGDANSVAGDADEGANQDSDDLDDEVDPDNLTPEQAEKIAEATNAELEKLKNK